MLIKLGLSVDISLSKVILGVAGITATICAFQYFDSKKKKLGSFSKTENKYYDYKEIEKEAQNIKQSMKQNCDAN